MRNGSGNWMRTSGRGRATEGNDARLKTKSRRPLQRQRQRQLQRHRAKAGRYDLKIKGEPLTSGQAGAQPFDPALRDLRMNWAAAQFTSSAPTEYLCAGIL